MVNTFNYPIFACFRTEYYKCITIYYLFIYFNFRLKRVKIKTTCITADGDANLNQCMVNTLVDQFREEKSY